MSRNGTPAQSAGSGGDREIGRKRCRALDIAARIVFGVSVMDRQIEEYLVGVGRHTNPESADYKKYVEKIHKMGFGEREDRVKKHITGEKIELLFSEIRRIKKVRNSIAHSTRAINGKGTVTVEGGMAEKVIGKPEKYSVEDLAEVLKNANRCGGRLREVLGQSSESKGMTMGEPWF